MRVGFSRVVWMTEPSWIDVSAPIRIPPSSPRSTTPGQTVERGPITTSPMTTASSATHAVGWMSGTRSPRA
jgi:hypothetical protein